MPPSESGEAARVSRHDDPATYMYSTASDRHVPHLLYLPVATPTNNKTYTMFHQGDLQSGISAAIQEQKLVACFIRQGTIGFPELNMHVDLI